MKVKFLLLFLIGGLTVLNAQTRIKGQVLDIEGLPLSFANIIFKNSTEGIVADEEGEFYLSSKKTYKEIEVSFLGYETKTITIEPNLSFVKVVLKEAANTLNAVVISTGRIKKKGNPAIAILEKVWAKKQENGLDKYKHYEYEKYEKIQFDINNIDEEYKNKKIFKDLQFVFNYIDTSRVDGKTFLPIHINESVHQVYGTHEPKDKKRDDLMANKNSGVGTGQGVSAYIKNLYLEYDVYKNHIKLFDKSFTSPIGKSGPNTYNYLLADSTNINGIKCYNIVYYPIRKNEYTFKGDFWVYDSIYAVQDINMQVSRSANLNWIKDVYLEREFITNKDGAVLVSKDFMMADFGLNKKASSTGLYGKRTTYYNHYKFNQAKSPDFYDEKSDPFEDELYGKQDDYWTAHRVEKLGEQELGVYNMIDELKDVPVFRAAYDLTSLLATNYIEFKHFDYGPVSRTFSYNTVEKFKVRLGARTYFGKNDRWRLQGYGAYGFGDKKFKYEISYKHLLNKDKRWIAGIRRQDDVIQLGAGLTTSNIELDRRFQTGELTRASEDSKLAEQETSQVFTSFMPVENLKFKFTATHWNLKAATNPEFFQLSYLDDNGNIQSELDQTELGVSMLFTPGKRWIYNGVERKYINRTFATLLINFSQGLENGLDPGVNYQKLHLYYKHPFFVGNAGKSFLVLDAGKVFGEVPIGLLNVVPANQSLFNIRNTFGLLDFFEFITDQYVSMGYEHDFNGWIFGKIPLLKKLKLRESFGIRGVYGNISKGNIEKNRPTFELIGFDEITENEIAPTTGYIEYNFGISNILKILRVDFFGRATYKGHVKGSDNFGVKLSVGVNF